MRKTNLVSVLFSFLFILKINAQLSGVYTIPGSYPNVFALISALNTQGTSGTVTVNINAGYTETVPPGGFTLTASGSATAPIIFQKSGVGANPLFMAYSGGTGTSGSAHQDGIWRFIGSDYISIDGLDLIDLNTSNPSTMEFGFGLCKSSASDGCHNNIIRNCVITLNRINNATGSAPASDGSRGIDIINATNTSYNTPLNILSASGSNSNNKIYSNTIQNCNYGISLIGYADVFPFSFADTGNDVGGNSNLTGNTILNFGGGAATNPNASAAIRTLAQYDLNVAYNTINNNNGAGINHITTLRGIHINAAVGANISILNNTLTLHGGGSTSQMYVIENSSGSLAMNNTVTINNNVIMNCDYTTAVSGSFYGIYSSASPSYLNINNNLLADNSTSAASGSTYLIYNSGAVASKIDISNNALSFTQNGSLAYSGLLYSIYNNGGTLATDVEISTNVFSNYNYVNNTGSNTLYFIHNNNDCANLTINGNRWKNLSLNHSGSEYLIYNNTSTQLSLGVNNNSIVTAYKRTATSGSTYMYYSAGSSPASCTQTFSGNIFSNVTATVSGSGVFYGIYNSDGGASSFPEKLIYNNLLSSISMNSSGNFYGYYLDNLGSAGQGSAIYSNTVSGVFRNGMCYGLNVGSAISLLYAVQIYSNVITNINSNGATSSVYGAYLSTQVFNFNKNKISDLSETGLTGSSHGLFIASNSSGTISTNLIGNIYTPGSSATNAVNGIYISPGSLIHALYNTVYINASSTGTNFNSNALYASTTASLNLRNNLFINRSVANGAGITAAYRRSSSTLTTYSLTSNSNLFYAGIPGPAKVIFYNGSTAYQTLANFQTAVSPRDANSVSQSVSFLNTTSSSPNYLHVVPNISSLTESGGINVTGISEDFDDQIRHGNPGYSGSGTAPDIGADEYDQNLNPCTSANAGTISPSSLTVCAAESVSFISNGFTPGTGLTHQWKVSTTQGGPYSNVIGGIGSTDIEFISSALNSGVYYFVLATSCTSIPVSAISNEATITVNAIPTVTAVASNTLICAGQNLQFSGLTSGALTYNWSGPAGYNSSLQNPTIVNVSVNNSGIYNFWVSSLLCSSPVSTIAIAVSDITLSIVASPSVLCAGNTTTLTLNSSATSFLWNTGATSTTLAVTPTITSVYSVVATNSNNCINTFSFNVALTNPTISAIPKVVCGTISAVTLSVNAFSPSVVNWYGSPNSPSLGNGISFSLATSLSSTLYAQASSSTGCLSPIIPVILTVSSNPLIHIVSNPQKVCSAGSATLIASGASTYSWISISSGSLIIVHPLLNTTFTVIGKNSSGCTSTETLSIETYSLPIIVASKTVSSICPSAPISFSALGANSYTWNNGVTNSVVTVYPPISSVYSVTGKDANGCSSSATISIATKSVPVILIAQSSQSACPGEVVTFTASGATQYEWLPGNSTAKIFTCNPQVSSVFNAIGTSINSCTNVSWAMVIVDPCTGLFESNPNEDLILLFPNPTSGFVFVSFPDSKKRKLELFDNSSRVLINQEIFEIIEPLDMTALSKGIYLLRITSENKVSYHKIILQ